MASSKKTTSDYRDNFFNKAIGKRLRELRQRKDLTQKYVATKAGVSRSTIANWEAGQRTLTFENVKLLCRIYGAPVDYVYNLSDHVYKVNTPDYFELDFTLLNDDGMIQLYDYYKYLISSDKFAAKS